MDTDLFNDLLSLEQQFYDEAFQIGKVDGEKSGRNEGRVFGLEKGFEKYVENGKLHGKSLVWASRLRALNKGVQDAIPTDTRNTIAAATLFDAENPRATLPILPENPRLEKHLRVLYALTEPASLSTENTEDAACDFDDRLGRAKARVKVIERLVGRNELSRNNELRGPGQKVGASGETDGNIEDASVLKVGK